MTIVVTWNVAGRVRSVPLQAGALADQPADVVATQSTTAVTADGAGGSVADEITKLDRLRSTGVISEQEFTAQKARVLELPTQRDSGRDTARSASRAF